MLEADAPREVEVGVRVIASATGLKHLADADAFLADLLRLLGAWRLRLPPLRERPEDLPLLANNFCRKYSGPDGPAAEVSPEVMQTLLRFAWPGSVRHRENAVERARLLVGGGPIRPEHLHLA